MIELKTPGEIDAIGAAGDVVGAVLTAVGEHAAPGVTPDELDMLAAEHIAAHGAKATFLHYHPQFAPTPYPAVTCISVNDAVVHGIPNGVPLADGDILSVDLAVHVDGWCADAAFSMIVGTPRSPRDQVLIDTAEAALAAGIAAAVPGARMGDVGHAIEAVARGARFGMLRDHGGHGVGRTMHEAPHVPNEGKRRRGIVLQPGLVIAIEPMLQAGGRDTYRHDADGWTLRTKDGSRATHAEHTIAVTEDGPRILTASRPS
jgi:methionyl aminopeptidase